MLHEFLAAHKGELIKRCTLQAFRRPIAKKSGLDIDFGIPLFLDQLIDTLQAEHEASATNNRGQYVASKVDKAVESKLSASATQHGRELSKYEITVDHLVHEYGDLCQAVTKLAMELGMPIDVNEFRIFNRCLDDAIASAVTEYSYQKDILSVSKGAQAVDERLRVLANEQRHHLRTASLAMKAIRAGNVGLNGATGAILELSLASLQKLLDRFLNGLGWSAELPARQHLITLSDFIAEVKETHPPEAQAGKYKFTVRDIDKELAVIADSDLLFMAVGTLLENSFKKVLDNSEIILSARASGERVLIEIASVDAGHSEEMLSPSPADDAMSESENYRDGPDLSMCRRGIEASKGFLRVRDVPGAGEVFTIDLPRHLPP